MTWLILEGVLALGLFAFIIWWTLPRKRERDKKDSRVAWVKVTKKGQEALHRIDEQVQIHVDYFTRNLAPAETEAALSTLMFYAGVSLKQK